MHRNLSKQSRRNHPTAETVPLYRAGSIVGNLLSAMGSAPRETRITAALAYLISLEPRMFANLWWKGQEFSEVTAEEWHELGRSDVRIFTKGDKVLVLEAKLDAVEAGQQVMKYPADRRIIISPSKISTQATLDRSIHHYSWDDLSVTLTPLTRSHNTVTKVIAGELLNYLRRHGMLTDENRLEIYAREINNEPTLEMFLKGWTYGCDYERNSRLPEMKYFAPHFGKKIVMEYPGVGYGISYVARIETIEVVESSRQMREAVLEHRGKWPKDQRKMIVDTMRRWPWHQSDRRRILFLGPPRLVFNPPVRKEYLVKGAGWLSKQFFSFDDLFRASGLEKIYEKE